MVLTKTRTDLPILLLHNVDTDWTDAEIEEVEQAVELLRSAVASLGHPVVSATLRDSDLASLLSKFDPLDYVVLNWCECLPGTTSTDYRVAQILEALGFTFTGAGSEALEFSWNKPQVKERLRRLGISTPTWKVFERAEPDSWNCFPAIVKAGLQHSSVGITSESVVLNEEETLRRLEYILTTYGPPAIVEDFVDGREFYVPVIGNGEPMILPPVEMDYGAFSDMHQRLCTYDAKFTPGSDQYVGITCRVPAPLSADEYARLEKLALAGFAALQCRDYARMDVRLRDGVFYLIDVNPNADISADASVARGAAAAGYSYGEMISLLVTLAAERHPRFGQSSH
ncbi:MAG: D-alanine--D-alanine ligase [Chloroflexi bacterium ADurb.Bin180]|nr:MAG: D-alanine--D-alanine ligase [Chloroflexi bacterium ADurb.Bin180]HOU24999.1 hypothetical protein [Anaerolineae bacterium]HQJ51663.1 hypothetical protein [Anaerolineae bacterium]